IASYFANPPMCAGPARMVGTVGAPPAGINPFPEVHDPFAQEPHAGLAPRLASRRRYGARAVLGGFSSRVSTRRLPERITRRRHRCADDRRKNMATIPVNPTVENLQMYLGTIQAILRQELGRMPDFENKDDSIGAVLLNMALNGKTGADLLAFVQQTSE